MRIEQLEYVAAVARLGSFQRAAQDLHLSQPALSNSVRSLERDLGVVILQRGRHGARVSEAGRDLLPGILAVLDAYDRLREAASAAHRSTRLVRVATASTATIPLLAPLSPGCASCIRPPNPKMGELAGVRQRPAECSGAG